MILHVIMLFFSLVDGQGPFSNSTTAKERWAAYQVVPNDPTTVTLATNQLPSVLGSTLNEEEAAFQTYLNDHMTFTMPIHHSALASGFPGDPDPTTGWELLPCGGAATEVNPDANMAKVTSVAALETVAPGNPSCAQCSIYYEFVNLNYWPAASSNTDCLKLLTNIVAPTPPPNASQFESPSAYAVFPTISANNSCSQVGKIYTSVTLKFAAEALSSIQGPNGPQKPFNFADLPCPPPDVASADSYFYNPQYNPGRQYAPIIAPPAGFWSLLDPAYKNCATGIFQGFDPPNPIPTAEEVSPADPDENPRDRHHPNKRAAAHAYRAPRLPIKTPEPVY